LPRLDEAVPRLRLTEDRRRRPEYDKRMRVGILGGTRSHTPMRDSVSEGILGLPGGVDMEPLRESAISAPPARARGGAGGAGVHFSEGI
jgi:hypothetical protein